MFFGTLCDWAFAFFLDRDFAESKDAAKAFPTLLVAVFAASITDGKATESD
jgi:hypothetical protein